MRCVSVVGGGGCVCVGGGEQEVVLVSYLPHPAVDPSTHPTITLKTIL